MNDFMKTILNAIQSWTKKEIKNSTSDWNQNDVNQPGYVKNRTHWDSRKVEEINITFDGNIEGKEYVDPSGNGDVYFVKVSDLAPSINEIVGGTISVTENDEVINVIKIIDDDIFQPSPTLYIVGDFFIVLEDTSDRGLTLTKGVWVNFAPDSGSYCSNLSYTITTGELKKIDGKYLPDDILGKMNSHNPVGTGSFSMNRLAGTEIGEYSHAEGINADASGFASHAEGEKTNATGEYSHAEGYSTVASSTYSHAEGKLSVASGMASHAEGYTTVASSSYSHAEGQKTSTASGATATTTTSTTAGYAAHAEGYGSVATGAVSHAEGNGTTASGQYSHSEGYSTTASGKKSHAEGSGTTASADTSHAEGSGTTASADTSHAEGSGTTASAAISHAEGYKTTASGSCSHAEGDKSMASGNGSHAEGTSTIAEGAHSHAEGRGTTARGNAQHVQGEYNVLDTQGDVLKRGKYSHIVGNGSSDTARSNAHTLDWDGNAWYSGDVYVGSASGTDKDEGSKKLATEEFVSSKIAEAELGGEEVDLSGYALKSELPSRVSQLQNDSGYITGYTEMDPTVPAWAKAASKPTYTASEVGADSKGTASSVVSAHNTATDAHNDIRLALKDINDRLNAFFDSDDKTLDELSEIVTYITSNKALIDSITTSKVSVSDIINNLTTNVSNKPLSAAQGVVLKGLIDTLSSGKLDASALSAAINTALAQAKASGEFDGKDGAAGATGVGIKSITI